MKCRTCTKRLESAQWFFSRRCKILLLEEIGESPNGCIHAKALVSLMPSILQPFVTFLAKSGSEEGKLQIVSVSDAES